MSQPKDRVITQRFIIITPTGLEIFETTAAAFNYLAERANLNITMPTVPHTQYTVPPPGYNFVVFPNCMKRIPQFKVADSYAKFWKSSAFLANARTEELKKKGYKV